MNTILRSSVRSIRSLTSFTSIAKSIQNRTIYHMVNRQSFASNTAIQLANPSISCKCGCAGMSKIHTKGERELVEFLADEVVAEKKASKKKTLPAEIDGFKVKLDGSEVEFIKSTGSETITISFNVNHTVDTEEEDGEIAPDQPEKPEFGEMKSKPTFEIDIKKDSKSLLFTCSFLQGEAQEGEYNDVFGIDELAIYEGEWSEKVYAVAGDVLDGYLYDLLMNFLEEKGISNEFAEKLSEFSTTYEHSNYISLLESLSKFAMESK